MCYLSVPVGAMKFKMPQAPAGQNGSKKDFLLPFLVFSKMKAAGRHVRAIAAGRHVRAIAAGRHVRAIAARRASQNDSRLQGM